MENQENGLHVQLQLLFQAQKQKLNLLLALPTHWCFGRTSLICCHDWHVTSCSFCSTPHSRTMGMDTKDSGIRIGNKKNVSKIHSNHSHSRMAPKNNNHFLNVTTWLVWIHKDGKINKAFPAKSFINGICYYRSKRFLIIFFVRANVNAMFGQSADLQEIGTCFFQSSLVP